MLLELNPECLEVDIPTLAMVVENLKFPANT